MEAEHYFVNQAFENAIQGYGTYKKTGDVALSVTFPVNFIAALCYIFGELDILVPYQTRNEGPFDGLLANLTKYGASEKSIFALEDDLAKYDAYWKQNPNGKNPYFVKIQKALLSLFIQKYEMMKLKEEDLNTFARFLYLEDSEEEARKNMNQLYAEDPKEMSFYFRCRKQALLHPISLRRIIYNPVPPQIYSHFNIDASEVSRMTQDQVDAVNAKIYHALHLTAEDPELEVKLEQAFSKLKKPLAGGHGKVDILLLIGFIAIEMMIILYIMVQIGG